MMMLSMANSTKQSDKQPFEKFTEAAKKVFNLPKSEMEKIKAKPTPKTPTRRK
jgi:hypothetical protein